jgi:hypothetical protein
MTEAELMQGLIGSIQVVIGVFSMFFAITSAYIAGLFFFLGRAPLALRVLAFFLLSIGLVFLAGSALIQQRVQEELFAAWARLPSPAISGEALRNPLPFHLPRGLSLQDAGVAVGWVTALGVYLALAYLTFFYRWERRSAAHAAEAVAHG